jgi:hypothetical protein
MCFSRRSAPPLPKTRPKRFARFKARCNGWRLCCWCWQELPKRGGASWFFFGALVIAFVVSVGGGTLRDVLLAHYPLFWVTRPVYFITVLVVSGIAAFILARGEKQVPVIAPYLRD